MAYFNTRLCAVMQDTPKGIRSAEVVKRTIAEHRRAYVLVNKKDRRQCAGDDTSVVQDAVRGRTEVTRCYLIF